MNYWIRWKDQYFDSSRYQYQNKIKPFGHNYSVFRTSFHRAERFCRDGRTEQWQCMIWNSRTIGYYSYQKMFSHEEFHGTEYKNIWLSSKNTSQIVSSSVENVLLVFFRNSLTITTDGGGRRKSEKWERPNDDCNANIAKPLLYMTWCQKKMGQYFSENLWSIQLSYFHSISLKKKKSLLEC